MARPPKPFQVLVTENKSHRTKKELETRKKGEEALLTGTSLKEWPDTKESPIAHKEFLRLKKLLKIINHDDALYEAVINRYCKLIAEEKDIEQVIKSLNDDIIELVDAKNKGEIEFIDFLQEKGKLQDRIINWDKKAMDKRKMLLQIERENIMTILGALKAVPRKEAPKKESPMAAFLNRKQAGNNGS